MSEYLFPPPPVMSLPVIGRAERFAVGRIFCVGRNYAAHAAEMGNEVDREAPFYFLKSAQAVLPSGAVLAYPPGTADLHHEIELVIAIGSPGFRLSLAQAPGIVWGHGSGLDMTRRDLQNTMKRDGRPWCIGKGFDASAPIGAIVPAAEAGNVAQAGISLRVNGEVRQSSTVSKLIWNIAETIEHLSRAWTLQPGDLIYTGTPEGVGAVVRGDLLEAQIDGLPSIQLRVA